MNPNEALHCAPSSRKSKLTTMTDDPRYATPHQPGQSPSPQAAQGYPQAGYQQPYDWRYATGSPTAQQHYQPGQTPGYPAAPPRKRSRTAALTVVKGRCSCWMMYPWPLLPVTTSTLGAMLPLPGLPLTKTSPSLVVGSRSMASSRCKVQTER